MIDETMLWEEILGWYGMIVIVGAYFLVSFGLLLVDSILYQVLNATGAAGIFYISFKKRAYQPGALNAIWFMIALVAIVRLLIQ
ncbi:hypothetical protein GOV11_04795 [Candidatus Woesearchaeota archaeon]|nr:hypothetical protein [Candidatus Woesearchaeota archaeon]